MKRGTIIVFIWLAFAFTSVAQDGSWNIDLVSNYSLPYASDIWGWEDSITGRRFAFVGGYSETYLFDITNPAAPNLIGTVPGPSIIWRDMKVWQDRLYIITEYTNSEPNVGIQIVNLRALADNNVVQYRNTFPGGFEGAHNIFIDEKGRAWLWGSTPGSNYVIDLSNPDTPQFLTDYAIGGGIGAYIHDGFVRGDTVWGGHIYDGKAAGSVFNDSSLSFSFIGSVSTPNQFTHNVWLSDDGKYLFTTDEIGGAPIGIYDVSDPATPRLLATFRSSRNPVIPHNVFYKDGFIYISYYTDGVVVADVRVPDLPVEVAWYDTSPFNSSEFKGCWGVFPFFNDDIIIASDMEQGLFILRAKWKPAVRVYVRVFQDSMNRTPIYGVPVRILSPSKVYNGVTDLAGMVKAGFTDSGLYKITVSLQDTFLSKEIMLSYGAIDTIDFIVDSGSAISSVQKDIFKFSKCNVQQGMLSCLSEMEIKFFSSEGRLIKTSRNRKTQIPNNATIVCINGKCNKIPHINVY